jgi:hypothetical protein
MTPEGSTRKSLTDVLDPAILAFLELSELKGHSGKKRKQTKKQGNHKKIMLEVTGSQSNVHERYGVLLAPSA